MKMYENLTRLIDALEVDDIGEWIIDEKSKGTYDAPIQMPFVRYTNAVKDLAREIYDFSKKYPEYKLNKYRDILDEHGIELKSDSIKAADVSVADGQLVMALLMSVIRMDRFCEGALLGFCKDGYIFMWLKRLKEIDEGYEKRH